MGLDVLPCRSYPPCPLAGFAIREFGPKFGVLPCVGYALPSHFRVVVLVRIDWFIS
jgi:hypothetical protein